MSRGPGRWQRALLTSLETHEVAPVNAVVWNILRREPSRAESVAARRAARLLAETGKARAVYLGQCKACEELSNRWDCPTCGSGCSRVLALTRVDGYGATIGSLLSTARVPPWLSVAPARFGSGATLSTEGQP